MVYLEILICLFVTLIRIIISFFGENNFDFDIVTIQRISDNIVKLKKKSVNYTIFQQILYLDYNNNQVIIEIFILTFILYEKRKCFFAGKNFIK